MNPRISVIIPTYQHATTIAACLEAIFQQTRVPDEIIVVDDGSTDETQTVLKPYADRIHSIVQSNQGAPAARNNGFQISTGDFVLFCDADLIMRPTMLETLLNTLVTHHEASYAYGAFRWGWKKFSSYPFDAERLKRMNYIHTSALIRRADFPLFDPSLKRFQDWDLWLTMLEQGKKGIYVPQELFTVIQESRSARISSWVPSFVLRLPWAQIKWMPHRIKSYKNAEERIRSKHHLV